VQYLPTHLPTYIIIIIHRYRGTNELYTIYDGLLTVHGIYCSGTPVPTAAAAAAAAAALFGPARERKRDIET